MYSLLLLGGTSIALTFLITPVVARLFGHLGVVDEPDRQRKLHPHAVPRVGGIAIVIAYLGSFAVLWAANWNAMMLVREGMELVWSLLPALSLVLALGFLDDLIGLRPWQKLSGQLVAAYLVMGAGIWIDKLMEIPLGGTASVVVTLLWLVGCTNAFNLIDGLDGLAAGAGLFAAMTMLVGALLQDNMSLALAITPLAGALIGFLRHNFNPASIFLGDGGSFLIGFLLGSYAVIWEQKSTTALGMTAPLMALSLPLLDTGMAMVRRYLRQQPIFEADRGHIHHRLLDRGLSPRQAVLLLYLVCGTAAAFSLIHSSLDRRFGGIVIVLFCAVASFALYRLGFDELSVFSDLFLSGRFRQVIKAQIALREFEGAIHRMTTPDSVWEELRERCQCLGFTAVQFHFLGRTYASPSPPRKTPGEDPTPTPTQPFSAKTEADEWDNPSWTLTIPIADSDYLLLRGGGNETNHLSEMILFASRAGAILRKKRRASLFNRVSHTRGDA